MALNQPPGYAPSFSQPGADVLAELWTVLCDTGRPISQRAVLMAHVLAPDLSSTALASALGCGRNTIARALSPRQNGAAASERRASERRGDASERRGDAPRAHDVRASPRSPTERINERSSPTGTNVLGEAPEPDDGPLPDLVLEAPEDKTKNRRTIAHGTGLTTRELAILARDILRRRRDAELATPEHWRREDNRNLRAMLAGQLRDGIPVERLTEACAASASLKSDAIAWQLNASRTTEARPQKGKRFLPKGLDPNFEPGPDDF